MKRNKESQRRRSAAAFGVSALLAVAATAQVLTIDSSGIYRQEVQACNTGHTQQSREDCLREARNAQADRQRGQLAAGASTYEQNATQRCNAFQSDEDRKACQARVLGQGQQSGSVASGGILRSYEYTVPGLSQSSMGAAGAIERPADRPADGTLRPLTPVPITPGASDNTGNTSTPASGSSATPANSPSPQAPSSSSGPGSSTMGASPAPSTPAVDNPAAGAIRVSPDVTAPPPVSTPMSPSAPAR